MGRDALLQGIFPSQGLNLGPLHCRQMLYCLSHQGSPSLGAEGRYLGLNLFVGKPLEQASGTVYVGVWGRGRGLRLRLWD